MSAGLLHKWMKMETVRIVEPPATAQKGSAIPVIVTTYPSKEKMKMFKKINYAGFSLPTITQTKSAVALGCWFATLMITHSLLMAAFGYALNKLNHWRMMQQMKKMQARMEEFDATEDMEVPNESVGA